MVANLESEMNPTMVRKSAGLLVFAFSIVFVTLLHAASDKARGDLTFKSHSSVCGKPISDDVLMIKDGKFRFESHVASGASSVDIYDCPRRRWIQVNDRLRTFMVREFSGVKQQPASGKAADPNSEIAGTVDLSDTGERKDFFGYSARRLKWKIVNQGPSCNRSTIYGEGWYIDPPVEGCYWRTLRRMFSHPAMGCNGQVVVTGPDLDKPAYEIVADTSLDEHFRMTIRNEVTSVSTAAIAPALFEVPNGYKQVDTLRELIGEQAMDAALATLGNAQTGKPSGAAPDLAQQLQFLIGEWSYSAGIPPECTFSIAPELTGHILVWRSNLAHCSVIPPDQHQYEDRIIFYVDPADKRAHALILDSEGQVLHFDVSVPEENKVVMESGTSYDGKRHRITFTLEQGALRSKYEITHPSGEYWTYMERLSPPSKSVGKK